MANGVDAAVLRLMQQLNADTGYRHCNAFGALITIRSLYLIVCFSIHQIKRIDTK